MKLIPFASVVLLFSTLIACGGGGSQSLVLMPEIGAGNPDNSNSDSGPETEETNTDSFVDSPGVELAPVDEPEVDAPDIETVVNPEGSDSQGSQNVIDVIDQSESDEQDADNTGDTDDNSDTGGGNTDVVVEPTVQTSELQASNDFSFATNWQMDIDFTLPLNNAFLSLCTDYDISNSGHANVQFDSCVIRATVNNAVFNVENISMSNDTNSLIAVLIDFANPSSPIYVEFNVTLGQELLLWEQGVTL